MQVTTIVLVRHGRTSANVSGVLAGRTPGVHLDPSGTEQATVVGQRLRKVPVDFLVSSPMQRTIETARLIAAEREQRIAVTRETGINEFDYGDWSGRKISELAKKPLWSRIQSTPSAVTFPNGESMAAASARAIKAVRKWTAEKEHGVVVMVSHGDIIKAILADALGMHLDLFQRIVVDPGSLSVIEYTQMRPLVLKINDTSSDPLAVSERKAAVVGGGAGSTRRRK